MMEEKVFRLPAVAGALEMFIEARLHTDGRHDLERILELQRELSGSKSNPVYVLIDSATEKTLGKFSGATFDEQKFIDFLQRALP